MISAIETQKKADIAQKNAHLRWRNFKNKAAAYGIAAGGWGVIVALLLIFGFLLWSVLPLFQGATIENRANYPINGTGETLLLSLDEYNAIGLRITDSGQIGFFAAKDGKSLLETNIPASLASVSVLDESQALSLASKDGRVWLGQPKYIQTHNENTENKAKVTSNIIPEWVWENNGEPLSLNQHLRLMTARQNDEKLVIIGSNEAQAASLFFYNKTVNEITEEKTLEFAKKFTLKLDFSPDFMLLDQNLERLYIANKNGEIYLYKINDEANIVGQKFKLSNENTELLKLTWLPGNMGILAAYSNGDIIESFPIRNEKTNVETLKNIRQFDRLSARPTALQSEVARRGFATASQDGRLDLYYATSAKHIGSVNLKHPATNLAFSPRADWLLVESNDSRLNLLKIENEHPELSWSALWSKVWYESYGAPEYIWQSSSASNDFEPKFSLTPLAFGTLKAAFYAMLFALPLALLGAIFAAYFMTPAMRQVVKPSIEVMGALPSVILGFFAGLWLAPLIEGNLPAVFSLLLLLPFWVLLCGWMWQKIPQTLRYKIPSGWEAALLIPMIILFFMVAFSLSVPIENYYFGGNMPAWLNNHGILYEQRNSIVVGIAMGFAVIPTIFSIAEDAIFGVPKHLTLGSLALGATPWQTLVRVVLPTASPGIFSGVMIGMGRAVGETMIVLMATGNTPVMEFSAFEGLRTLSANIAVEMPEAEVGSTHFRILFLAGLVLFVMTFMVNTIAEIVRQRLREKYGNV